MPKQLQLEVWSDIACPWCYVGKRRLESALSRFPARDRVQVTWRSFELDPAAPPVRDPSPPYAERLAQKYGTSRSQAEGMIARMVETAASDGIAMDFDRIRPGNTFDAHRLLHLARAHGEEGVLTERFMRGYLCEGAAIGDRETLLRLAVEAGLDADEATGVLSGDLYADAVRADQREARDLGISGVPFFLLGRRYAVSGAQPADLMLAALEKTWEELPDTTIVGEGQVCGPDGCE